MHFPEEAKAGVPASGRSFSGISVSDEVQNALAVGSPVLALESAIFTHGLPRPRNVETALQAEAQLREAGVTPATIAMVDGVPRVGLSTAQIERLATEDVAKLSLRELPAGAVSKLSGGVTVAVTAYLAHAAGVRVMATGGLGGVHYGARTSFDESADLTTLAATPIAVVSAGVKSILDTGATLERLETFNVPVVGYATDRYPGFYVTDSGYSVKYRIDTPEEAAALVAQRDALGLQAAVLVANPIPPDRQLSPQLHEAVLAEAFAAAEREGITGQDTSPFLLDYLQKGTDGKSIDVNVDIYQANVALGARIAQAVTA